MSKKNFNITHHRGEAKTSKTAKGVVISREEKLFVESWGAFVSCTPYDEHFIYENPDEMPNTPVYLCTCGGVGVVVPPAANGLFVCLFHATYGQHQTSVIDKETFEQNAGQTLRVKPARKWE